MKFKLLGISIALVSAILVGCEPMSNDEMSGNEKSGLLTVKITDAPFPAELVLEANVTIDLVQLKRAGDGITNDSAALITILEEEQTFNLLELSNGVTEIIAQADIPTGEYNEMRLRIVGAGVALVDTTYFDLEVPSGNSSGLKLKIKPSLLIVDGIDSEALIDFDLSRSFKTIGNAKNKHGIKGFHFKPVIRVVNLTKTGDISGIVSNVEDGAISDAFITLFNNNDTVTSALSEEDGYYAMIGLPVGTYSMECVHQSYDTLFVPEVVVSEGVITEQNLMISKSSGN